MTAPSTASPPAAAPPAAASRRELAAWLVRHTRSLLPPLGIATLARILGDLLGAALLVAPAIALGRFLAGDPVALGPLALLLLGISALRAGLRYLEHYAGHWVAFAALQRLRQVLFGRLIPQAPAATTGPASAEITERATRDIDRIEVFFAHTIPPVIASVVVPAAALTWLAVAVDPRAAGIIAIFLAAALLLPFVAARRSWAASRAELTARGELATHVSDDLQGLREVLAFEAQERRIASLRRRDDRVARAQLDAGRTRGAREAIERLLWTGALVALLLSGLPVADVITSTALLVGLWLGGAGTDDFATGLDGALAAADRVRRTAEAAPAVAETGAGSLPGSGPASVRFEGVGFAYPGARAATRSGSGSLPGGSATLTDVDLTIEPGGWHHLVGISGSGKSTVASLLQRVWDPDAGRVLLDGVPLRELSLREVRRAVAVVPQRPLLFPGTVADNLRLGAPDASDERLAHALRIACLDGDRLPDGLATRVGERGTTLSGGQLQRVALARALVAAPRVLVLDESLSQLDAETAATVRARLDRTATILEITHRADLLEDTAAVTVIDRGRIVERGTAAALAARDGAFARLLARY